jgi:hypothetical protein
MPRPKPVDPSADPAIVRTLLAVARLAHAEVERAGFLNDDLPELALATVARWCDGKATDDDVRAALKALRPPDAGHGSDDHVPPTSLPRVDTTALERASKGGVIRATATAISALTVLRRSGANASQLAARATTPRRSGPCHCAVPRRLITMSTEIHVRSGRHASLSARSSATDSVCARP